MPPWPVLLKIVADGILVDYYAHILDSTGNHDIDAQKRLWMGLKNLIIADTFMTYNISVEDTLKMPLSWFKLATAVKCEAGKLLPPLNVWFQKGFQWWDIGLQPQYIHESGGYNIKGGSSDEEPNLFNWPNP